MFDPRTRKLVQEVSTPAWMQNWAPDAVRHAVHRACSGMGDSTQKSLQQSFRNQYGVRLEAHCKPTSKDGGYDYPTLNALFARQLGL